MLDKSREKMERAEKVRSLMKHEGYNELEKEWQKIKEAMLKNLELDNVSPELLRETQFIYKRICLWMDIPHKIVRDGEKQAVEKENENQLDKQSTPLKSFLTRFKR
jgi:F0F1-type ATP synthase alpha subunit